MAFAANRFIVGHRLGEGSFSKVYEAYDTLSDSMAIALKVDTSNTRTGVRQKLFAHYEASVMNSIHEHSGGHQPGIPRVFWTGFVQLPHEANKKLSALAMERLGHDLESIAHQRNNLSEQSVLHIGIALLDIIVAVHRAGIVHRDIKPANCLIGTDTDIVYLNDFGLSKRYLQEGVNGKPVHIAEDTSKRRGITGTIRYCSHFAHRGVQSTRRDDMITLGYMLTRLITGRLPWEGEPKRTRSEIGRMKYTLSGAQVTQNLNSGAIGVLIDTCKALKFDEEPPYAVLRDELERASESFVTSQESASS